MKIPTKDRGWADKIFNQDQALVINDFIDLSELPFNSFTKKKTIPTLKIKNIPANLKSLFPLLKKWSVSDDAERDILIEKMTASQKEDLKRKVTPLMKDINVFLDSFENQPLSEEAIRLGNLAEMVSELN